MRHFRWRVLVGAMIIGAVVIAAAAPAAAHASFVSASPAPGTGLPEAPGAVAIRFSEPLNLSLSRIDVFDAERRQVGAAPTEAVPRDPFSMRRRIGFLRPGQYTVEWLTVSALDGHTLRGSYDFAIGTGADSGQVSGAGPLGSEGPLGLVGRWVALVGLALWAGSALLAGAALVGGLERRTLHCIQRLAPVIVLAGGAATVVSVALVSGHGLAAVVQVLAGGRSGHWQAAELAAAASAVAAGPRRLVQLPLVGVALVAEAASGHAGSSTVPPLATVFLLFHLASVGIWVFAILAGVLAPATRRMLAAMAPYAVAAALAVVVTGTLNAAVELDRPSELLSTGYGRTVLVKVAVLAAMAALGLTHSLRRRRIATAETGLRRPVRLELAAAGVAIAVATVLVGFPNPPRQSAAAERAAGPAAFFAQLGRTPALSVAAASGPFVVGLTVMPPEPGPVTFRVQVLGVDAADGLGDANVGLSDGAGGAGRVMLGACGLGCFTGRGRIPSPGNWNFTVAMASTRQPIHADFAAPVPTPDGAIALQDTLVSQQGLRSASMHEELRGAQNGPAQVAGYRFSAPNAFEIQVGGNSRIVIGARSYEKADPTSAWVAGDWPGRPFTWPSGYFSIFWGHAVAVRVLGHDRLDGADMSVISLLEPDLPAWFRLWVGVDDGLVHHEEMRAEGHLMDHTYTDLNTAPPVSGPQTAG